MLRVSIETRFVFVVGAVNVNRDAMYIYDILSKCCFICFEILSTVCMHVLLDAYHHLLLCYEYYHALDMELLYMARY